MPRNKPFPEENHAQADTDFSSSVKNSASRIWLAGLGALARAQQEGGKLFDNLVQEGADLQRHTQAAGSRISGLASDLSARASGRLEALFDERLERSLERLGVPDAREFEDLLARVEELEQAVSRLEARRPASSSRRGQAPDDEVPSHELPRDPGL